VIPLLPLLFTGKVKWLLIGLAVVSAMTYSYVKGREHMALKFQEQQQEAFDAALAAHAELLSAQQALATSQAEARTLRKRETQALVEEGRNEARTNAWPIGSCPITESERRVRNSLADQSAELNRD
jgi:hypothetical protein